MRHRRKRTRLGRMDAHRKATIRDITRQLIMHQSIKTTLVKAKETRRIAERLIHRAKKDSLNARRRTFDALRDRSAVTRLFKEIAPLFMSRVGGYTRIVRLGNRRGDGAEMVLFELTARIPEEPKEKKKKERKVKAAGDNDKVVKERGKEHASTAPEISAEVKEQKTIEDVKKDKARKEQKKEVKKGFFKKFFRRRTQM